MPRDLIRTLYYPDSFVDFPTLKKAILLFDELHFMDRPSMSFGGGQGQLITIGMASELRRFEASFRENGVPLYVHEAPQGSVYGEWYEQIKADVNDLEYLRRFQNGLSSSTAFRNLQIAPGNYGQAGSHGDVARALSEVHLATDFATHGSPIALFEDGTVKPFDHSRATGRAKTLVSKAVICSAKLNFALRVGAKAHFVPLADAKPYGDLLGAKYARAVRALQPTNNKIQTTDLSFAIFDALISPERLKQLSIPEVIKYRKESETAREQFLEHLSYIEAKQAMIGTDGDYAGEIQRLIRTEVEPAVTAFRNRLRAIDEALVADLAKRAVVAVTGSSAISIFGDLSWQHILQLAVVGLSYVSTALIDSIVAGRAAARECSVAYLLSIDE